MLEIIFLYNWEKLFSFQSSSSAPVAPGGSSRNLLPSSQLEKQDWNQVYRVWDEEETQGARRKKILQQLFSYHSLQI